MPYRQNFFGERIYQPGSNFAEIEQDHIDVTGVDALEISSADLYTGGEDEFKFGGLLFGRAGFYGPDGFALDDEQTEDVIISFDGFETIDAARDWLLTIGITPSFINEVDF